MKPKPGTEPAPGKREAPPVIKGPLPGWPEKK